MVRARENREAVIADWCLDSLELEGKAWGLRGTRKDFPQPQSLPTLWNVWSLRLADIYVLAKGGTLKSTDSFQWDLRHYADAAYADEFVTADEELLKRLRLVDRGSPRCVHLRDFIQALLQGQKLHMKQSKYGAKKAPAAQGQGVPRIEYLRVQNYRSLKDLVLEEISPLTVLLGPNGSGKSTVFDVCPIIPRFRTKIARD